MKKNEELDVTVHFGGLELKGILGLPPEPHGVILFAHGSGSGRLSPRNQYVAGILQDTGIATLLIDLLAASGAQNRDNVFDVDLLARRLLAGMDWITLFFHGSTPPAYFGASTGAAAALLAAASKPKSVEAIVSRGGRPDLAEKYLPLVRTPTLLIVGGDDQPVIDVNRRAYDRMNCEKDLRIIPGATISLRSLGPSETVAEISRDWFLQHFHHSDANLKNDAG